MPTYVYRCDQCGDVIERRQSFQDPPLTQCEACHGRLQRVLQPVGIIFKGSGFYSTDYRAGASSSTNGSSEKSESGAASESTKATTPKPSESASSPTKDSGSTPPSS